MLDCWFDASFGMHKMAMPSVTMPSCYVLMSVTVLTATVCCSDKWEKWQCLCLGLVIQGIGMCLFSLANDIGIVCMCLALVGGGMAFIDTPILPLLADIVNVSTCKNKDDQGCLLDYILLVVYHSGIVMSSTNDVRFYE